MKPQLLREVEYADLDTYLDSDDYAMSQKLDGTRVMIKRTSTGVQGIGRSGGTIPLPGNVRSAFMKVKSDWTFDGELIGDTYHVFDVVEFPGGTLAHHPWRERHKLCQNVLQDFASCVKVVPQYFGDNKRKFFQDCNDARTEGVVFSNVNGRYRYGTRSPLSLKYKFVKTIDCIVIDKEVNSKDNIALGVYDNGELVDIGKCSAITGDGKKTSFNVGDVVTVTYLYGTNAKRLYQPVRPMLRTDKEPQECLMDQMILKSDTIL